jgi:hypothetical protein
MGEREKLQQAREIERELNDQGLSRRAFLDRLKVLGVGFGAAAMLGVRDFRSDASLSLKSTNPALNNIIEEGRQDFLGDGPNIQMASERYSRRYSRYARIQYLWLVVCRIGEQACAPRDIACPSDDDSKATEMTRVRDYFELKLVEKLPDAVCACPKPPEVQQTMGGILVGHVG